MIEESHVIDPNGEVMIILRNANAPFAVYGTPEQLRAGQTKDDIHEDVRIQVSAKHLMLASPVFEKALTGPWKEGVSLDMKGSTEISAENWDTEALLTFLRVIHCQFQSVPQEMSLELLAKVAVISDYYGCQGALRFFSRVWVQEKIIPRNYSRDLILWLWITWFFDLSGEFHNATSIAMSQCSGEIPSLGLPIPPTIIEHMNTLKKASLMEIWSLLEGARVRLLHGEHGCHFECRAMLYGVLSMHMHDNQLGWPIILEQSYEKSAQAIESVRRPRWREPCNDSGTTASNRRLHNCPDCNFTRLLGHVEQSVEGLDLDT
ncbi:hypothetical protein BO94DRAFT_469565 [Aspergillus sclerotioniger CBS 115572]|uniref:BTB domain-containing protein n=1 Tax=Aspergillus sclerotioniger CBS 115572 TaxID=1450535 RepID=A0A317WDG3_9EURO|nr:hypothetical protein BO94DRAFT_469565 [Aspergillus sclerotioniger CBS 115572]PWY83262.1 hypothetical protein BO94DRAFT_469565 [Aspergillus sclerotioniger CBS 115572]